MPFLKVLDVRDNKIKELPEEISKMEQLTRLDVSNNTLSNLPNSLGLLKRLQSLRIEGNMIRSIRRDIIQSGTTRILKFLRDRYMAEQERVDNVDGESTKMKVPLDIFPDKYVMKNARSLNLMMKQINTIPDEVFINALEAQVTNVDLSRNKFEKLPPKYINHLFL